MTRYSTPFCYSRDLLRHEILLVYTLAIPRQYFDSIYSLNVQISKFLKHGICVVIQYLSLLIVASISLTVQILVMAVWRNSIRMN